MPERHEVAAWWYGVLFVAVVGSVGSLTVLFRSMRAVVETGASSCASGGAYVIANPCPKGVAAMTPMSIWAGLGFVALASVSAMRVNWPSIAWLAWPALFLSLGWNFWEFGLFPAGDTGIVWSWIVCGALFVVMGGGPLVLWIMNPKDRPQPGRATAAAARAAAIGTRIRIETTPPPFRVTPPSAPRPTYAEPAPATDEATDLIESLERLAALHRDGALTDAEFAAAKQAMIGGTR